MGARRVHRPRRDSSRSGSTCSRESRRAWWGSSVPRRIRPLRADALPARSSSPPSRSPLFARSFHGLVRVDLRPQLPGEALDELEAERVLVLDVLRELVVAEQQRRRLGARRRLEADGHAGDRLHQAEDLARSGRALARPRGPSAGGSPRAGSGRPRAAVHRRRSPRRRTGARAPRGRGGRRSPSRRCPVRAPRAGSASARPGPAARSAAAGADVGGSWCGGTRGA